MNRAEFLQELPNKAEPLFGGGVNRWQQEFDNDDSFWRLDSPEGQESVLIEVREDCITIAANGEGIHDFEEFLTFPY